MIKRNMSALPAYSLLLGLIALLGYMAIAAGIKPPIGTDNNTIVPQLFDQMFPDWFTGVAYAAIGIGALVPAAIMSIAAANLFTRNIYKEYIKPNASDADEARVSKITSLLVKVGAMLCILFLDTGVLHRPPAHRRRHHPADAPGGGPGPLHPLVPPRRPDRRMGRRHGRRNAAALQHRQPGHRQAALRRIGVPAGEAGTRHQDDDLRGRPGAGRQPDRRRARHVRRAAAKMADGGDATQPDHYLADEGDPRVKDLDLCIPYGSHSRRWIASRTISSTPRRPR